MPDLQEAVGDQKTVISPQSASPSISHRNPRKILLPLELRAFCASIILLAVICAISECIGHFYMHRPEPYNWPFIKFYDNIDVRCFIARFHYFHQLRFFSREPALEPVFGYPAPGAVLYKFFYLAPHPIVFFFIVSLSLLSLFVATLYRAMRAEGISLRTASIFLATAIVFSYPLWFEFLLGNLEIMAFLMIAAGVLAFLRGHSYMAAALFAIAGSIKIVPLIFLGLLVARKQYRQFLFAIVMVVGVTLTSLWLVYPNIAVSWRGINMGLNLFRDSYLLLFRSEEVGFDHSIFGAIKQFTLTFADSATTAHVLAIYTKVAALVGLLLFFLRIRKLAVINQILCLTLAELLLPPTSIDYTLLTLYVSWGLLLVVCLQAARQGRRIPGLLWVFLCFAVLMSPETEIIAAGQSYGGQMKCFILLVLMGLALYFPFRSQFDPICELSANEESA